MRYCFIIVHESSCSNCWYALTAIRMAHGWLFNPEHLTKHEDNVQQTLRSGQ